MIARGNKGIAGRHRGAKKVTAVYRGTKSVWTAGHVFDNVITGTTVGPNQSFEIRIGGYVNYTSYPVTSDDNGKFSVKVDMEGVTELNGVIILSDVNTLDLNRLDTSNVVSNGGGIVTGAQYLTEVDMSMCDISNMTNVHFWRWCPNMQTFKVKDNFGSNPDLEIVHGGHQTEHCPGEGAIWREIIVEKGFDRVAAGYSPAIFEFWCRRQHELESGYGMTDELFAQIADKGYTVVLYED